MTYKLNIHKEYTLFLKINSWILIFKNKPAGEISCCVGIIEKQFYFYRFQMQQSFKFFEI